MLLRKARHSTPPPEVGESDGVDKPETGRINIRTRIALAVIVLVGLALGLVGVALFAVQRAATEAQVIADLGRAMDEFETLATEGVDPQTGQPFADPSRLLLVALQRTALSPTEGELAVVNGAIRYTAPEAVSFRPELDRELRLHLLPLTGLNESTQGEVETQVTRYRYYVMPVVFGGHPDRGALIRLVDLSAELEQVNQVMRVYLLVAFGSMLLVAAFTWVFAGRLLRPIEWLREVASSIRQEDLTTRVPVTGSDDLTALTVTINRMLDRVQDSVESQRRLLDDVGHELRTPVTVVRGHLELMDVDDPEDVQATQALAIDELDRMGGLVNDLITLAKSDSPDFIHKDWSNIAVLTDATLEKARALGDHRWRLSQVATVDAFVDPNRITQAWLQLAANADKYSEAGTKIEIGSAVEDDELRMWVADEGIGIAAEDMDLIRSRFGRSSAGKAFNDGAGLGLAIVGSIVASHDGRLDIESTPGAGSKFTMVLPLTPQQEDGAEHDIDH